MLSARPIRAYEFSGITVVSLLCKTEPNLGDHTQTNNAENANENGHNKTGLNLREKLRQDCKTFIHRFDSDRRLQSFSIFLQHKLIQAWPSRGLPPKVANACLVSFAP